MYSPLFTWHQTVQSCMAYYSYALVYDPKYNRYGFINNFFTLSRILYHLVCDMWRSNSQTPFRPSPCPTQGLMGSGGHQVSVLERRWNSSCCHQATDMSHVCQQVGVNLHTQLKRTQWETLSDSLTIVLTCFPTFLKNYFICLILKNVCFEDIKITFS